MERTSGTWYAVDTGLGFSIYAKRPSGAIDNIAGVDRKEDAVLMAMAPRMLDMLKDVARRIDESEVWWMDAPDRGGFDYDAILDMIARAEGR